MFKCFTRHQVFTEMLHILYLLVQIIKAASHSQTQIIHVESAISLWLHHYIKRKTQAVESILLNMFPVVFDFGILTKIEM